MSTFNESFDQMVNEAIHRAQAKQALDKPNPSLKCLDDACFDVRDELLTAMQRFPEMNSAHEGWAVIYEELDELWDEVRAKQGERDRAKMRKEAMQVAAMAVRFMIEVCDMGAHNK